MGVYIAKYSYNPPEMSPNQNFDLELPLAAGDYLYVYGDMDDDGYYHAQLMTGESGMVPSNFIEKVTDDTGTSIVQLLLNILYSVHGKFMCFFSAFFQCKFMVRTNHKLPCVLHGMFENQLDSTCVMASFSLSLFFRGGWFSADTQILQQGARLPPAGY